MAYLQKKIGHFILKLSCYCRKKDKSMELVQIWSKTMKVCSKCKILKEESEYTWSIRGIKKHSSCNSCRLIDRMDYYQRNKEKELTYKWDRQLRKREEAKNFVDEYKRSHFCVDCGSRDSDSLTFDHVFGVKKMNIANMVSQGYSINAIRLEMSKCELRCFNCHMKIEKKRRSA